MKDENITTPPGLTPAEAAVSYLLQRVQHDVDLRYHLIGIEAFYRLCVAEAQRTGQSPEHMKDVYSTPADPGEQPKLVVARRLLEQIGQMAHDAAQLGPPAVVVFDRIHDLTQEAP